MNILVLHWGAYTHSDILQAFSALHIKYNVVEYVFEDKNNDDRFLHWFTGKLKETRYDAVFSFNYFPLIAQSCAALHIKYISWCYDCPLNVWHIEETLGLNTNYVFFFDRMQAKYYRDSGFTNIYHLPLAINPSRLSNITLTSDEQAHYSSDVSFVGKLYHSTFPTLLSSFDDYTKGYLTALASMQLKVYGEYFVEDLLTEELLSNCCISLGYPITKEQLAYSLATYITHNERLAILSGISEKHMLKLYSNDSSSLLPMAIHQGYVRYFSDMPKVFMSSRININITVKNTPSGMPLRVLDILGCGGFLLSNYQPELAEYFIPDTDYVYYESIEDAIAKTDFYLAHEDLRSQIAQNGCRKCRENFTYEKQLHSMLQSAGFLL